MKSQPHSGETRIKPATLNTPEGIHCTLADGFVPRKYEGYFWPVLDVIKGNSKWKDRVETGKLPSYF